MGLIDTSLLDYFYNKLVNVFASKSSVSDLESRTQTLEDTVANSSGNDVPMYINIVTYDGATVTATKDGTTISGTASGGICQLEVEEAGVWTVTTTYGTFSNTSEVEVAIKNPVELSLPSYVYLTNTTGGKSYITIDGTNYTEAGVYKVIPGSTITLTVAGNNSTTNRACYIKLDGTTVLSGAGSYTLTIDKYYDIISTTAASSTHAECFEIVTSTGKSSIEVRLSAIETALGLIESSAVSGVNSL